MLEEATILKALSVLLGVAALGVLFILFSISRMNQKNAEQRREEIKQRIQGELYPFGKRGSKQKEE